MIAFDALTLLVPSYKLACYTAYMVDKLTPEARSENMRRIRSKDTGPELIVRRMVHAAGLRYRLHKKGLSGRPDLVFTSRKVCVFVHGCFWHGCPKCVDGTRKVKSNTAFWRAKVEGNRARDARHREALEADGWRVLIIWACEVRDPSKIAALIEKVRLAPTLPQRIRKDRKQADDSARHGAVT